MTSTPDADERLTGAHDLALSALREITPASSIGPAAGYLLEEDGSVSLRFENRLPGYPGWYWTVTVARVEGEEPTVLEVELLPSEGALLAPEWVPWAERLAEYRAHQAELAEQAAAAASADDGAEGDGAEDDDADEDSDDELDLDDTDELEDDDLDDDDDDDDDDLEESRVLHAGDVDGVDIDELDESDSDDDDEDDADSVEDEDEDEDESDADDGSDEEE